MPIWEYVKGNFCGAASGNGDPAVEDGVIKIEVAEIRAVLVPVRNAS